MNKDSIYDEYDDFSKYSKIHIPMDDIIKSRVKIIENQGKYFIISTPAKEEILVNVTIK